MQILVISDIHANLTALEAVLEDAGAVDAVWCLGDLVGYGPDPNECVARVRELPNLQCVMGNHDAAALGQLDLNAFNAEARLSIRWLQEELSAEAKAFLADLPDRTVTGKVTLVHGSPRNPVWEYILDTRVALNNFKFFDGDYCLVGHTHIPVIYEYQPDYIEAKLVIPQINEAMPLKPPAILNPGSVGQPRDRNPDAAYALFNSELNTWEARRVAYSIDKVQQRIMNSGLPLRHAYRLTEGW